MQFACPSCSQSLQVPDDLAGKTAACPKCGNKTIIPTPAIPIAEVAPPKLLSKKIADWTLRDAIQAWLGVFGTVFGILLFIVLLLTLPFCLLFGFCVFRNILAMLAFQAGE